MDVETQLHLITLLGLGLFVSGKSAKQRQWWGAGFCFFALVWFTARQYLGGI